MRLRGVGGSRARWWGFGGLGKNFGFILREMKSHSDVLTAGKAFDLALFNRIAGLTRDGGRG